MIAALLAGCAVPVPSEEAAGGGRPIVVASDLDNPPFAHLDARGEPAGRDVVMLQRLARRLSRSLEWKRLPFQELLPAAERGEVDVVCATLGITPERAERVLFTRPYFETSIAVLVRAGPGEPNTLAELSGRRVAASEGTTAERAVRGRLPKCVAVIENEGGLEAEARLALRDVDAVALDAPAADRLVGESGGKLVRLADDLEVERYALALPKDRAALRARLDVELQAMEGELRVLDAEYGLRSR